MILSYIFGYGATVASVIGFQLKKQWQIIISQFVANLLVALSYFMLGGSKMAGGAVCMVAAAQTFTNYLYFRNNNNPPKLITGLSLLGYIAASVVTIYLSGSISISYDLLPLLGSLIFLIAVSTQNSTSTRFLFLLNTCVWIAYDIMAQPIATANLVTHICILISVLVGIFRYDFRPKAKLKNVV